MMMVVNSSTSTSPQQQQQHQQHIMSGDEETEHEPETRSKRRASSSPTKGGKGGGGGVGRGGDDGQKEGGVGVESRWRKGRTRQSAAALVIAEEEKKDKGDKKRTTPQKIAEPEDEGEVEEEEEEEVVDDDEDDDDDDSDDKGLHIADTTNERDSDDSGSDSSEDLEHPVHNGTMTRRQASQLRDSGTAGDLTGAKKKNRTCDYCGVVKATPAALVRHLRKHTGERPFVCALCGKAYKAKRSLNLHENTVHKGLAKNPLPTQIPLDGAAPGTSSFAVAEINKLQVAGVSPPISDATKSLLRETLESSRKARDANPTLTTTGENGDIIITTTTNSTTINNATSNNDNRDDDEDGETAELLKVPASERLAAPNLVNLLTSDLTKKVEQILTGSGSNSAMSSSSLSLTHSSSSSALSSTSSSSMTSATTKTALSASVSSPVLSIPKITVESGHHLVMSNKQSNVKVKKEEEDIEVNIEDEEEEELEVDLEEEDEGEEEQAQDLSMRSRDKDSNESDEVINLAGQDVSCEFCSETFRHESQKVIHIRQAHGIILNLSHNNTSQKQTTQQAAAILTATTPFGTSVSSSKKSSSHQLQQPQHHHHHNHTNTITKQQKQHRQPQSVPSGNRPPINTTHHIPATTNDKQPHPTPIPYTKMDTKKLPSNSSTPSSSSSPLLHGFNALPLTGSGNVNAEIPTANTTTSANPGAFMDHKTWAAMIAAATSNSTPNSTNNNNNNNNSNNNNSIATAEAVSALLARQMRDPQFMQQMYASSSSSPSSLSSTLLKPPPTKAVTTSLLGLPVHPVGVGGDGGGMLKMEAGGSGMSSVVASIADGTAQGQGSTMVPMEENNTLPYYVTSRILQDFSPDDVTLPESDKWVTAEDGGHRRCRTTIMKETVLATRLDGINNITGRLATVYKCHLCRRVFSSLARYNHHMPSHAEAEVTTYDCRYCEASFRSHIQIIKHLQCHREKFVGLQAMSLDDPSVAATTPHNPTNNNAGSQKKKGDNLVGTDINMSSVPLSLPKSINTNNDNGNGALNLMRLPSFNPADENGGDLTSSLSSLSGGNLPASHHHQHEPGERKNGGYSCTKCRKSFTREYLLQRHMRIHRNDQPPLYCQECEMGFSGELALMEHKNQHHGLKSAEEVQKYKTLLTQLQFAQQYGNKQSGNNKNTGDQAVVSAQDGNNNNSQNNKNKLGSGLKGSGAGGLNLARVSSLDTTKAMSNQGVEKSGASGNGSNAGVATTGAGMFPMVDLKGIDLRRGEEVQVRMMGGLSEDRQKEEWLKQFWNEKYKQAYLSKMIEMQTAILAAGTNGGGRGDGGASMLRDVETMKQNLMRAAQERMKWMIMEGEINAVNNNQNDNGGKVNGGGVDGGKDGVVKEEKTMKQQQKSASGKSSSSRQQSLPQPDLMAAKQWQMMERKKKEEEESERKRKMEEEQAQLKATLAQQGMEDVIVVLPDAPSPDDNTTTTGRSTATTASSKMDDTAVMASSSNSSSKKSEKLEGMKMDLTSRTENDVKAEVYNNKMMIGANAVGEGMPVPVAANMKRPQADAGSGPPAKSRRKALKPQKINHYEEEEVAGMNKDALPITSLSSSLVLSATTNVSGMKGNQGSTNALVGTVGVIGDKNTNATEDNTQLMSKWKQLVALGGAQVFSAAAASSSTSSTTPPSSSSVNHEQQPQMSGTPLSALTARNLMSSNQPHKLLPGFDPASGAPVLYNNNSSTPSATPSVHQESLDEDSCDGMAIDLSTSSSSTSDKDKSTTTNNNNSSSKSASSNSTAQAPGPQFSSTPKVASKSSGLSALSAAAAVISAAASNSLSPSHSMTSPIKSTGPESVKSSFKSHQQKFPNLSRSSSIDGGAESDNQSSVNNKNVSSSDAASKTSTSGHSSKTATPNPHPNPLQQQAGVPPLNPVHFTNALLSGATGMNPETAALVGLPQVLWSAAASGHHHSNLTSTAGGKSPLSSSSSLLSSPKSASTSAMISSLTPSGGLGNGIGKLNGIGGGSVLLDGGMAHLTVNTNSNSSCSNKSRTSSPSSSVPSPIGAGETASGSNDGRKVTSLSRTHSRLSVVNEPLDRNALCKPKVMEDGRSVYSCAICHKNFLSLSDINRHMDFHEDIRPYKCKYCDYYARTNSQLKVHKLRHEGVREFCCRVCNYKGVTQSDLNRHTKSQVHLLRSNHVCQRCGEGFVTPKALRDHEASPCLEEDSSFDGRSFDEDKMVMGMEEGMDEEEEEVEGVEEGEEEEEGVRKLVMATRGGEEMPMEEGRGSGRDGVSSGVDMRMVV